MLRVRRSVTAILGIVSLIAMVGLADAQEKGKVKDKGKEKEKAKVVEKEKGQEKAKKVKHHVSGKDLLGDKIKTNGKHVLDQKGKYTAAVTVKGGKIAGVHVKHSEKGEVPVIKYKTKKRMAAKAGADGFSLASNRHGVLAQLQDLGTTYIGYAYTDEYGEETIYWFPYEMIYDGDTGAIEYVEID